MKKLLIAGTACLLAACAKTDKSTGPVQANCFVGATGGTDLSLTPGQVQVLSSVSTYGCIKVPSSGSDSRYLFIATHAASDTTIANMAFKSTSAAGASAINNAILAGASPSAPDAFPQLFEKNLRAAERRLDGASALENYRALQRRNGGVRKSVSAALPNVGDTLTLRVPGATNPCSTFDTVRAVVQAVGSHGVFLQDTASPAGGFTAGDYAALSIEFDTYIYPADTSSFGSPSDLDVNGHVYILFTPEVNKLTPRGSSGFVGGFFFGGDLFPRASCNQSNVGEIFYLLAPDPAGVFSDPRQTNKVRQASRGTLGHEFQHMIDLGVRLKNNVPQNELFEDTWLSEALAHEAEDVVGRWEYGFTISQSLNFADVTASVDDFNAFFYQNAVRYQLYLKGTDTTAVSWDRAGEELGYRGAAWSMVRWATDQYGAADERAFLRALTAGPQIGISNIAARTGQTFPALLDRWLVANYADDAGIAGLDPVYTYPSYNLRDIETNLTGGGYPINTHLLGSSSLVPGAIKSGSGMYFVYNNVGSTPALAVSLLASDQTNIASYGGAQVVVLRAK